MSLRINLRHLAAALEIRRLGSISRATRAVHLSQSAITQGIGKLEEELGFKLFDRSHEGLAPTETGEIFLQRANSAIGFLARMDQLLGRKANGGAMPLYRSLTVSQLRSVMTVVDERSYTLAARRLQLSQPTVHRAAQEAESVCGQTLFSKSPAGVEPSWYARHLARYISLFFAELAQGIDEVEEHRGRITGRLRIGSLPLARTRMVPRAVVKLLADFPEARVSIIDGPYDEQLHALLHGRLDVIVGALRDPAPSPEIEQILLFEDPLSIVFRPGHPLAQQKTLSPQELRRLDWIAPREDTPAREAFVQFFENSGLSPPEHVIECSSLVATRGMLMESDRAALLSARQVDTDVGFGLLAVSSTQLRNTGRKIGITQRKGWKPTLVQRQFLQRLQQEC
ncbi:MAG: LysR family transcriptional regulator [Halioglobus sp.]|nr:LysR family transcriptional regulator [Halioglobus sp.]|tara:strand:- start:3127 stop:4317 length:1191 start_codon:yes stop_codon:yes gene_type:complete